MIRELARKISFLALLVAMVVIAFQSTPVVDDYCFMKLVEGNSFLGFLIQYYNGWSGRISSTVFLTLAFRGAGIANLYLVSVLWALTYLFLVWRISKTLVQIKAVAGNLFTIMNLLLIGLSLPLSRALSETVYWSTGGAVYVIPYAFFAVWLGEAVTLTKGSPFWRKSAFIMLAFLLGLSLESVALGCATISGLLFLWALRNRESLGFRGVTLAAAGAGLLVLVKAPGNGARMKEAESTSGVFDFSRWPENFSFMVTERGSFFVDALASAFLIALLFWLMREEGMVDRARRRRVAVALLCAMGVAASLFSLLGSLVPPRTFSYVAILIVVAGVLLFLEMFGTRKAPGWGRAAASWVLIIMNLYLLGFFVQETVKARNVRLELEARLQMIHSQPERKDWIFAPVASMPSRFIHFDDLDAEPDHWKNACFSDYLGLDSVRIQ